MSDSETQATSPHPGWVATGARIVAIAFLALPLTGGHIVHVPPAISATAAAGAPRAPQPGSIAQARMPTRAAEGIDWTNLGRAGGLELA